MAISIRATGVYIKGTANLTPAIPTEQLTGDMMLCFYGTKPYSDAPTIDQGWTSLGSATDGTVAAGIDVGSMQVRVFYKIALSDTETNPVITNSTNDVSASLIIVFQKGASDTWATLVGAGGGDATAGTDFSVTASSDVGHTTGDMVAGGAAFRSDSAAPTTARSITIAGVTMGTYTQSPAADLSTISGGDMGMSVGYVPVNSGTSTAAPVFAITLADAHTGSAYIVRLRVVSNVVVTPTPIFGIAGIVIPTVILGSLNIIASALSAIGITIDPLVILGSLNIIPPSASAIQGGVDPTVDISSGGVTVIPDPIFALANKVDPVVILGSLVITPNGLDSVGSIIAPTVILGSLVIIPSTIDVFGGRANPTVVLGSISLTPDVAWVIAGKGDPTVDIGGGAILPEAVFVIGDRVNPSVLLGSTIAIPSPIAVISDRLNPDVVLGSLIVVNPLVSAVSVTKQFTYQIAGKKHRKYQAL